ncbi:(Fe-S)-binding protein [Siminovitchia acidinfaciens]|uniref:Lactate utilization protein A n=1 Tax=Siminovitchia acidinfaciens TaxID=2321395 RepID=A0A429XUQ0_9BACI|nr:(Fe-S)-binding protein [Siminovitchia acidinfaciens]RST71863.1 (Fe-S)-binding protein [Siminovitchia acidinfaciens]
MKVSLFITCLADVFYPEVGMDVVEVLERAGCEVDFPEEQTCCGQPAYSTGYLEDAKEAMKQMMRAFADSEYVVTPSGSCAYMFKEYPEFFKGDPEWEGKAKSLADKTYEFSHFLVEVLKMEDMGAAFEGRATYHKSCHMTRLLGVKDAPFTLLKNVKGLVLEPLPRSQDCCGFGGTFSVKMGDISSAMVDEKVEHIKETGADVLIGGDCGCLMNIGGRIEREGLPVRVMHLAEVLNKRKG